MTSQAVANYANNLSGLRQNLVEAGSAAQSLDDDKKQFESSILNQSSFLAKAKATEGLASWAKQTDTVRAISTKLGMKVGKSRAQLRQAADDAKQALQEETDAPTQLEGLETANAAKQAQLATTQGQVAENTTLQAEKATEAASKADAATEAGRVADEAEEAATTAEAGSAAEFAAGNAASTGADALASTARAAATAARASADTAATTSETAAAESAAAAAKGTELATQAADHTTQATEAADALAAGKTADEAAEVGEAAAKAGRIEKLATGLKDTEEVADAADAAAPDPLAIFVTAAAAIALGLIGRKVGTHTMVAPTVAKAISYSATAGA